MQVKQRLHLNAALSIIATAVVLGVLLLAMYRVNLAVGAARVADEVIAATFERLVLRNDYIQNGSDRAREQVRLKFRQISDLLKVAKEKFPDPADQRIIADMAVDNEAIGRAFRAIVSNREKVKAGTSTGELSRETEERLLSQLNARIYGVVIQARKLQASSREALFSALRLGGFGTAVVLLLVMAGAVINSWTMGRSITERIRRLRDGASRIGTGELDHRIDVQGDDELAELAQTVNAMTAELQGSYRDLENEIGERRRAEAELDQSRKFLEIANRHHDLKSLLREFVEETKAVTGCEAVGIRLLDEQGNIPYLAYDGFSQEFYEKESPLNLESDRCMCINVVKGTTDPALPFYTEGCSFYMNGTTRFLATVSEADKGQSRNVCNQTGYESVALIPIRVGEKILGLIHLADRREEMVPEVTVKILEQSAAALGAGVQRALAEEELRRQYEWFKGTLASIGDAVIATDASGRITFINPTAQVLTGWPLKDALGQPVQSVFKIINEETREAGEDIVARVLAEGAVVALANQTALVAREGREVPIEDSAAPIKDREGAVLGVILVFHDVTGKRRGREALQASEKRYRTLFEAMTEGFSLNEIICDDAGKPHDLRYLSVNPAFEHQTGLSAADVVDRTMGELFPEAEPIWFERYGKVALTGEPAHFEEWFVPLGRCFEVSAFRTEPGRFAVIFLDITDRKRAEKVLEEHAAKLEAVNRELEKFSHNVSHDLRVPLRAIDGFSRMILRRQGERFDPETRRQFEIIRENVRTVERLIADLLDFARLGRQGIAPVTINMEEMIRELARERLAAHPGRKISFTVESMPTARADRALIRQVLGNLLDNAVKFTGGRDEAVIEAGSHVMNIGTVYYVRDNGIGFDMRYYDRLFGVFQRLPNAEGYEGTGMDLAEVQRIIHKHGGQVWAEGKVDAGATFYFTLPE